MRLSRNLSKIRYCLHHAVDLICCPGSSGADLLDFLGPLGTTGLSCPLPIGKKIGARVIAIAGSQEKVDWLEKELGFREEFIEAVGYLDVYFDNVGGSILNLALSRLKLKARIILCGAIADYNQKPTGLTAYTSLISQRAKIEGFLVMDYKAQYPIARADIGKWIQEDASSALPLLFSGGNTGKLVVKVADLETASKL
ncbi:hypothetical protein BC629DRAFT_1537393 [Irpex lacteus]|nr:hypothetical protein BC629DRAFT_1537393 [Irpex lacteus]